MSTCPSAPPAEPCLGIVDTFRAYARELGTCLSPTHLGIFAVGATSFFTSTVASRILARLWNGGHQWNALPFLGTATTLTLPTWSGAAVGNAFTNNYRTTRLQDATEVLNTLCPYMDRITTRINRMAEFTTVGHWMVNLAHLAIAWKLTKMTTDWVRATLLPLCHPPKEIEETPIRCTARQMLYFMSRWVGFYAGTSLLHAALPLPTHSAWLWTWMMPVVAELCM